MVLDLGERNDWFHSPVIVACAAGSALALLLGVLWELNHREPILNLRVLKNRNLGLACVHMLIFGGVLFGSTALLPLFMQTLLGYTAEQSGLALSPGGVAIAVMMPFVGFMVARVDVRWMIVLGILIVSYALWMMGGFTLQTDFRTIVITRVVQGVGLGLIFVPLNTVAYATIPATERNNASSLISIARNIGGSVGIGYAAAMLTRGAQVHQNLMVHTLTPESPAYSAALAGLTQRYTALVGDATRAAGMAQHVIAAVLDAQARALSYLDQFKYQAVAFLVLIPVVLLMRRRSGGGHVEMVVE
jgi:DHA2 family multidrug resistance protein